GPAPSRRRGKLPFCAALADFVRRDFTNRWAFPSSWKSLYGLPMRSDLDQMKQDWLGRIAAAADLPALEGERVAALGKQGAVTGLLKSLGAMSPEQRQS